MGIVTSRDTRRISFDNTFAITNALTVPNSSDENILDFDKITTETPEELIYSDSKNLDSQEDTEDYWSHRIEHLKREHQIINKIIESEYEKEIESTLKAYEPKKITHERIQKIKPCLDWRAKIMKCYEDNPHQPLVCSSIVQAFNKCIASCRVEE